MSIVLLYDDHAHLPSHTLVFQLWRKISNAEGFGKHAADADTPFTAKSVHYFWHLISQDSWRLRADDALNSAKEFIRQNGEKHNVALLDVTEASDTRVLAFKVTDFIDEWAAHT